VGGDDLGDPQPARVGWSTSIESRTSTVRRQRDIDGGGLLVTCAAVVVAGSTDPDCRFEKRTDSDRTTDQIIISISRSRC